MTDKKLTAAELQDRVRVAGSKIQMGRAYKHGNGNYYVARMICLRESDLEPLVVYGPIGNFNSAVSFARPLEEFLERFKTFEKPERSR